LSKPKRGRPPRSSRNLSVLHDLFAPVDYERLLSAADLADDRPVTPHDAARLLWWACIGHEWTLKYESRETKKSPEKVISSLEMILADVAHQYHRQYWGMARDVAAALMEEENLQRFERQQIRSVIRARIAATYERLGGSEDILERALTRHRRRIAPKGP
jgi:hypothetical protein